MTKRGKSLHSVALCPLGEVRIFVTEAYECWHGLQSTCLATWRDWERILYSPVKMFGLRTHYLMGVFMLSAMQHEDK